MACHSEGVVVAIRAKVVVPTRIEASGTMDAGYSVVGSVVLVQGSVVVARATRAVPGTSGSDARSSGISVAVFVMCANIPVRVQCVKCRLLGF